MDYFYTLYADYILKHAIELNENDILSINAKEEYLPFARILAEKAKEITGNGSYLVALENNRAKEAVEVFSDYLIEKSPTVFIYLQGREREPEFINEKLYSAREAQLFNHLSGPIVLPHASVAFITVPMIQKEWAEKISSESDEKDIQALISDFLSLNSEESESFKDVLSIENYDKQNLNAMNLYKAHLYTDDGMTDLTFTFLHPSEFKSLIFETENKRRFIPHLFGKSYFRPVERYSASGHVSINNPFILFGKRIESAHFNFEDGKVISFGADVEDGERLNTYFSQDEDSSRLAEISITELFAELSEISLFSYPEWDRLRGVVITLGAPRAEGIDFESEEDAINAGAASSLFNLSLSLGNDVTLSLIDEDGDEHVIYQDGYIEED